MDFLTTFLVVSLIVGAYVVISKTGQVVTAIINKIVGKR